MYELFYAYMVIMFYLVILLFFFQGRNSSDVSFKHRKYEKVIDVLSNEKLHFSSSKPIEPKKFCDDGLTCRTPTKRKSNLDILSTPPKSPHRCLRTPMKLLEQPTQKSNKHIAGKFWHWLHML